MHSLEHALSDQRLQSEFDSDHVVRFADDTVIVSLLHMAEKALCPILFFNGAIKPFQNRMKQFSDVATLLR